MVRYEDLVMQPHHELLRVCGFLQVPWEPSLLSHSTSAHTDVEPDGAAIGGTASKRAIDARSVGRWRDTFNDDQLEDILQFAGAFQSFIYPPGVSVSQGTPERH